MQRLALTACSLLALGALTGACGGESDSGGSGGVAGSGGSSGSSGAGGGGGSGGSAGSAGGAGTTPCGSALVCDSKSVCMVDEKEAHCVAKVDDAGTCAPGQTDTLCGGIGYPCCCDPPPPNEYRCVEASACGPTPDCACLAGACKNGEQCLGISGKPREFHCSDPPAA